MRYLIILSLLFCSIFSFGQKKKTAQPFIKPLPASKSTVNDFGKFLSENERQWLETELVSYHARTGNAIVFISLNSLTDPRTNEEYTIEETALLYFNRWGIGDKTKNNGILLMMSRNPRRVRITVGRGLEAVLTDQTCQGIIDNNLVPNFKQGLIFPGIKEGVQALEQKLDPQPPVAQAQETLVQPVMSDSVPYVPAEKPSAWEIVGWLLFGLVMVGAFILLMIKLIKMIISGEWRTGGGGYYNGRNYIRDSFNNYNSNNFFSNGGRSSWSSGRNYSGGGSSGSSSSSSSSSGGSYGGGSSSGGGASGSW